MMISQLLFYNDLNPGKIKKKFDKCVQALREGDYQSAETKKLKPTPYYRAKIDHTHRLLFKPIKLGTTRYLLLLEVIADHAYEKSRFLRGAVLDEEKIRDDDHDNPWLASETLSEPNSEDDQTLSGLSNILPGDRTVHLLDKFLIFDAEQHDILNFPLPLVIIGSAGSGKTSVSLERMRALDGQVLYVSLSAFLVQHTQRVYYSHHYENDDQIIDFMSFTEFLQSIRIPEGQEITANRFVAWYARQNKPAFLRDGRKLFEEFRGVITACVEHPYLSRDTYLGLGVKQSIYPEHERRQVYALFERYLSFLKNETLYDSNIIAHHYHNETQARYDAIVVDEIQDFTNSQLDLILRTLNQQGQFLLCGDANQIVHPNFFSWSRLKSYFYTPESNTSLTHILTRNYRNSPEVTELANRILKLKNARFGSIDKDSHHLVRSTSHSHGEVACLTAHSKQMQQLNERTRLSTHYAILVLTDDDKEKAAQVFDSPLIFSVQEAKGLEYPHIILFQFVSEEDRYNNIAAGVSDDFISAEHHFSRAKNKHDKSLEVYKFYINALYVAVTRAVKNVYFVESNPDHRLLQLLAINTIDQVHLVAEKSSQAEWQKEASKLAQQGKEAQAKAITDKILQQKEVPWQCMQQNDYQAITDKIYALEAKRKEQITALNYATTYEDYFVIRRLQSLEVRAAANLDKSRAIKEAQYFDAYSYRDSKAVLSLVSQYGLEFRNPFNLTPLMTAAHIGNGFHVEALIAAGASRDACDNQQRNALMIAVHRAFYAPDFARKYLPKLVPLLLPDSLSLQIDHRLYKLDAHKSEFFFMIVFFLLYKEMLLRNYGYHRKEGVTSGMLTCVLARFPDSVVPSYRKRRSYVSSLLSRNTVGSNYPRNRHLFIRVERGYYLLNPDISRQKGRQWLPVTPPSHNDADLASLFDKAKVFSEKRRSRRECNDSNMHAFFWQAPRDS